jgi:tetratricopeptide (TPR) repeat protein
MQIDVLDVETHQILARGYTGLKQFEKALEECLVALKLKPEELDIAVEAARAEAAAGKRAAALTRLEKLLENEPDHEAARKLHDELE